MNMDVRKVLAYAYEGAENVTISTLEKLCHSDQREEPAVYLRQRKAGSSPGVPGSE